MLITVFALIALVLIGIVGVHICATVANWDARWFRFEHFLRDVFMGYGIVLFIGVFLFGFGLADIFGVGLFGLGTAGWRYWRQQ